MLSRMGNNSCGVQTMWPRLGQRTQDTAAKAAASSSGLAILAFTFGTHVIPINSFKCGGRFNLEVFDVALTVQP